MQQVSFLLKISFVIITLSTVYQFYNAANKSKNVLFVIGSWMFIQMLIGSTDFYTNGFTKPPRFVLMVLPPLFFTLFLFFSNKGKIFIDNLDFKKLTILHTIRIPVEIALYFLFISKAIPQIMTFEGRNFDIFAGLTAPIAYWFSINYIQNKRILIFWNIIALVLLANIVVLAILSAQTPFQQFGFEQPNIAITHFPFNWLPSVVVSLVLFSHLAALRQLLK